MVSRMNPHLAVAVSDGGEKDEGNGVEVKSTQPVDHWAFLDEIEAPMWADLNSEAQSTYQEIDDQWFRISHPFHQCSSRRLISAVFRSGEEGCTDSIFSIQGLPSPKLPPSVSRSRGKYCKSKEWGQSKCKVTFSKPHPVMNLTSKSSWVNSGSGKEVKPKSGVEKLKENEGSKASFLCVSGLTDTAGPNYSNAMSSFGDSKPYSHSLVRQEGESPLISTVTSEGTEHQQKKSWEVSSQIPGHTSGLLSTLKISLRRSCSTRQASRVEVNGGRKSEGCKSSSSKSSVGSSSHPGYVGKNLALGETQNKDKTPDSRNLMRICQAPRNKLKVLDISKAPAVRVREISSNSRQGNEIIASKETAKAKVQQHVLRAKVLVPRRVNEQDQLTARKAKEKVGAGQCYNSSVVDKGAASGITALSRKSKSRDKPAGRMGQLQKASNQAVPQKSDRKSLWVDPKEKTTGRCEGKESTNVVRKVYFR